jgi:hypothetical protein
MPDGSQPQDAKLAMQSACDLLQQAAREIHKLADRCAAAEASLAAAEAQQIIQQTVLQAARAAAVLSQRLDSARLSVSVLKTARRPKKASTTAAAAAAAPLEEAERVRAALDDAAAVATTALASLEASEDGEGNPNAALVAAAGAELRTLLDATHAAGAAVLEASRAAEQRLTRGKSPLRRPRRRGDPSAGAYAAIEHDMVDSSDDSGEEPVSPALETGSASDIMTPLRAQQRRGSSKGRSHGWLARVLHADLHPAQQSPRRAKGK